MTSTRSLTIGCFTLLVAACSGGGNTSTSTETNASANASSGGTQTQTNTNADAGTTATPTESSAPPATSEAIAPPASPPPPATPALALGADFTPTVTGLPAISADGATIAVGDVARDGLRGAPNLTLRLFNARTGAARPAIAVLSVAEGVRAGSNNEAANTALHHTVDPRLTRAQAAIQGYRAITPLAFDPGAPDAATRTGHGAGLDLVFTAANGDVTVTDTSTHATRYHTVIPAVRAVHRTAICQMNPALVREAWTDAAAGVLVIHVEYSGTDSCVEPDGSYRVVHLTAASAAPAAAASAAPAAVAAPAAH